MLKNLFITKQVIAYWFVLALGLIAIAAKYKYNGLVFGFDYGIYQPDGKYYTYMALDLINNDPKDTNPILSPNNKWILYRDINTDASKQYKPIYNIQETVENNNNIFLGILYFSLIIGIVYLILKK